MVGRDSNYGPVFSWADEVEKEEEEEEAAAARAGSGADAQLQQWQKPNPFGCARPREVVLQEKGIDWRKLDLHLHQHSPLRHESENEKLQKQSNSQSKSSILNERELNLPPTFGTSPRSSHVNLTPQIQSPMLAVPPLRYPPKFVAGVLYEHWVSVSLNASNSSSKHEKEIRFHEKGKAHNMMIESAMCENRRRAGNELVQAKGARRKGRNLEESLVHENKAGAVSATVKEKPYYSRNSFGLPVVNERIGTYQVQDKRMAANVNQIGDIQDVIRFQVSQNGKANEDKWQKITRKVKDLSVKQVENCKIKRDARKGGNGETANVGRNNKKSFEKKQFKLKT